MFNYRLLRNNLKDVKTIYRRFHYYEEQVGIGGWMLLAIPVTTFALGTWQVKRKIWKENLIKAMLIKTKSDPLPLNDYLNNSHAVESELEYSPVCATGTFLHDKELYLGPRSLISDSDEKIGGGLISQNSQQGYLVITPFKLENSDTTILVNRGWVPTKKKNPATRKAGQIEGVTEIVGLVRSPEYRSSFIPRNNAESNHWFYRDIEAMAEVTGSETVFLDLTKESSVDEGPISGQTRVNIRNEHLSYILTWYSLSAATGYMWYNKFMKKTLKLI